MISLFRRLINSKVGIAISFVLLVVFALLFGMGDVLGLKHNNTVASGDKAVTVGKYAVSIGDVRSRVEEAYTNYQAQQPGLTLQQFVAGGGMDAAIDQMIDGLAMEQFAAANGMQVSDTYVQSTLASAPAFQGADGKFNQRLFDEFLTARRTSYARIKQSIVQETLARQLLAPMASTQGIPMKVALPYAALVLEKREGQIATIPASALPAGPAPTDAELQRYYATNVARYTVPARRVIRYALVTPDVVKAQATPSDAEIAAQYAKDKAKYAAAEKRTVTQVVIADQAAAAALAAKVKGGTSVADAAKAIGLSSSTTKDADKAAFADQTSPDMANAVFGAAKGAVVGPVKTPLGFVVGKVDDVTASAGKTLEQARGDIATQLGKAKATAALSKIHDALDDAINGKASFGDLVNQQHLTAAATPALVADGTNPDDAAAKADPALQPIVKAGFAADPAEGPQMVPVGSDGGFALLAIDRIVPAQPRPLAQVRDKVAKDFGAERAEAATRTAAGQVVAALDKGTPLAAALAAARVPGAKIETVATSRTELGKSGQRPDPAHIILFNMGERSAKAVPLADGSGYQVVWLAKITPVDPVGNPQVIAGIGRDLSGLVGREYAAEFARAIRSAVGVSRNEAAIAKLKAQLTGQGGDDQQ